MNVQTRLMIPKIHVLKKDLERRKYRAFTYCNPNLANEFSPQCQIVWKSIEYTEITLKNKKDTNTTNEPFNQ